MFVSKTCINLYQALIRSVLEYGCEIWGNEQWIEGERIQREMARRILRCNGKTTNEAVLGELGWWRLKTRREYGKLKYWIRLLMMDNTRLVKNVYQTSKEQFVKYNKNNWCSEIYLLVIKYDLLILWNNENKIKELPETTTN